MSVTAPDPGFDIVWSTAGPGLPFFSAVTLVDGIVSGTNNKSFTPALSDPNTYYAFTRNIGTGCLSLTGLAVTQTRDIAPSIAIAGSNQPSVCASAASVMLNGSSPGCSGCLGSWTVPGLVAYYQNFSNFIDGVTSSTGSNGWTINVSGANVFSGSAGTFQVVSNHFEANNTNGTLGSGSGIIGEVVWSSSLIDVSSIPSVTATVDLLNINNDLLTANDYIKVFYKLNGGGEVPFTTNGNLTGNFTNSTASVTGLSGITFQIVIRISNQANANKTAFDNIVVRDASASTISFADANNPTTTVTGLPSPLPGTPAIPTTLTWTVTSALGVCSPGSSNVIITINPLPTSNIITPQLCDDITGAPLQAAGINLSTSYSSLVSDAISNSGTVDWYNSASDRSSGSPKITTPVTVADGQQFFFRATSPISCVNDGSTTFTVNALPAAVDLSVGFCEDAVGAGSATGIDLTSFEMGAGGVTSGGTSLTRQVDWYEDNGSGGLGALIPVGNSLGQNQNYTITATKVVHAKITDLTSLVTPQCSDIADLTLQYKPRPINNPVQGSASVCIGNGILLYQLDPTITPSSTYTWNVVGTPSGDVLEFGGGGTNTSNFFSLLKFPTTGTVDIDVVETLNGCDGNHNKLTVAVNNAPVPVIAGTSPVCANQSSVSYSVTTPTPGSTYVWTVVDATFSGSGSTINVDFNINSPVTIQVTETSSATCVGTSAITSINVNQLPVVDPTLATKIICSGDVTNIDLNTSGGVAAASYTISLVSQDAGLTGTPTTGSALAANAIENDVFVNKIPVPLHVVYRVVANSGAGCSSAPINIVLTVNPEPVMTSLTSNTICSGSSPSVVFTSSVVGSAFSWSVFSITGTVGGTAIGNSGTGSINQVLSNTSGANAIVTYRVIPQSPNPNNCVGGFQDVAVTVTPQPVMTSLATNEICSASTPSLVFTSNLTGSSFSWTVNSISGPITGTAIGDSGIGNINQKLTNSTNANVMVTYRVVPTGPVPTSCNGAFQDVVVTVDPQLQLTATPFRQTVCEGLSSNVVLSSTTTPSGGGTMQFNLVRKAINLGLTMTSTPKTVYLNGETLSDIWSNDSTETKTVIYKFIPIVNGGLGCQGDSTFVTLDVNPSPVISSTIVNPSLVPAAMCSDGFVNITLTSDVSSTVNSWTASVTTGNAKGFSGGSGNSIFQTLKNSAFTPANVRYHVTPKASGCTGSPIDIDVEVDPTPDVLLTAPPPVCYGATLNVPLSSSVTGANFNWTVGENNSGVDISPASGSAINYVVKDTLTSAEDFLMFTITAVGPGATACTSPQKTVSVLASPKMSGIFQNDSTWLCTGGRDFLQISLQGQAPFTLQYTDGTSTFTSTKVGNFKSIQVQPTRSTTYTLISLQDNLGCTIPLSSKVVYTDNYTDPTFILSPTESCTPDATLFTYNQQAGTQYDWQWGDGNDSTYVATVDVLGKIIKHTFINTSLTSTLKPNVVLTTSLDSHFPNGCAKSSTKAVTVYAQLRTRVAIDKTVICSGDVVKLSNQTVGVPSTGHKWFYHELGNSTQLEVRTTSTTNYTLSIDSTKTNPLIYEIVYQSTNTHCPADTAIQVTVYKSIKANFTAEVPNFVGGNSTATFNNTSRALSDWPQFRFDWNFGLDSKPTTLTSSSTPINVNYSSAGPRDVTLLATNVAAEAAGLTCANSITKVISVLLAPLIAEFKVDPKRACFPVKVRVIENLSTGDLYKWSVIDRKSSDTIASSTAVFPIFSISNDGSYIVRLVASSSFTGQTATDTAHVTLYPKPEAIFDAFPQVLYVPDQDITTINGSGNTANQYLWDFGDGSTSTEFQPSYKYKFEGVDSLKFTAQYDHGGGVVCSSTNYKIITAKQGGVAKIPNAFTPSTAGPSGGVGGVDLYNYVFLPLVKGVEEFNMQIFDRWGNMIFESNNQTIGWDGYDQHGKLMPAGVYVYKLTLRLSDQQRTTQVGDVTLIR